MQHGFSYRPLSSVQDTKFSGGGDARQGPANERRDDGEEGRSGIERGDHGADRQDCKGEPPVSSGPAVAIALTALNGVDGFIINGIAAGDGLGTTVAGAGDLIGDGYADLLLGAPNATRNGITAAGEAYIVFGHGGHFNASLALASLGAAGVVLTDSTAHQFSHLGLTGVGLRDVNGDGIADLAVGAPGAVERFSNPPVTVGTAQVLYGATHLGGATHRIDLAGLTGNNGFALTYADNSAQALGSALAGGDVNGDGIGDLLVSSETGPGDDRPAINVLFGGQSIGDGGSVDPIASDPAQGFRIIASQPLGSTFVSLVPVVGDFTGDGVADIAVGQLASNGPSVTFGVEVIPGGPGIAAGGDVVFGAPLPGSFTFTIDTPVLTPNFATTGVIADAGDVNGDGIQDLIVGIGPESFVIFGGSGIKPNTTLSSSQLDGHNGFALNGAGTQVSSAGDFNGDGIADLLIAGATNDYIVFGGKNIGESGSIDLTALGRGAGVVLTGGATSIAAAGDVNRDGFDDVVLGNPGAGPAGQAYVVFGTDKYNAPTGLQGNGHWEAESQSPLQSETVAGTQRLVQAMASFPEAGTGFASSPTPDAIASHGQSPQLAAPWHQ